MQNLQISDYAAKQLHDMAVQEHISSSDLLERLIEKHSEELAKHKELKSFFKPYQKDMTGFRFDREEANAR
jgi:hypothetical protein